MMMYPTLRIHRQLIPLLNSLYLLIFADPFPSIANVHYLPQSHYIDTELRLRTEMFIALLTFIF